MREARASRSSAGREFTFQGSGRRRRMPGTCRPALTPQWEDALSILGVDLRVGLGDKGVPDGAAADSTGFERRNRSARIEVARALAAMPRKGLEHWQCGRRPGLASKMSFCS